MHLVPKSVLFVPGNRPDMFEKAANAPAGAIVPDMEDAVPWGQKQDARREIAANLDVLGTAGLPVIPRLNSLDTGLFDEDLEAVIGPRIIGVSVGKVRSAGDVRRIDSAITASERRNGLRPGSISIYPWIETARAIASAYEVCSASPRIAAVCFGAEDFSADVGIAKDLGGWQSSASSDDPNGPSVAHARGEIIAAAVSSGVGALDTPYVAFRDPEGLARETAVARSMGFNGKCAIHPAQLEIINDGFSPTEDEITNASRIIAAADEAEESGSGATSLDGKMIDRPTIVRAQNLLARLER
ncbi:MAG: CoA ester lyase [Dehalococcoidia bacterium]|nr:CoA ester lyase [Dehalococcoidia bacterium]